MEDETNVVPNITLYAKKGDTWTKTVVVKVNSTEEVLVSGDDTIYFSIKETNDSETYTIQKVITDFTTEGYAIILMSEEETKTLTNKRYKYDCQWSRTSTNFVKTLFEGVLSVNNVNITEEGA